MTKNSKLIYFIISITFFVISDVYFSDLILNNYLDSVPQNSFFDLIFVQNQGAAFSLLENFKGFLITFSIFALGVIFLYIFRNIMKYSAVACFWAAMLVAGISCNLYERIVYGYVRDFIKLNFVNFPVFNISDVFINVSVFALVIIIIKNNYIKTNENNN